MIVTCENCTSRFRLADERVGTKGAKVRCSKCQHTFVVHREDELEFVDDAMLVTDDTDDAEAQEAEAGAGEWQPDKGKPSGPKPLPVQVTAGPGEWQPTAPTSENQVFTLSGETELPEIDTLPPPPGGQRGSTVPLDDEIANARATDPDAVAIGDAAMSELPLDVSALEDDEVPWAGTTQPVATQAQDALVRRMTADPERAGRPTAPVGTPDLGKIREIAGLSADGREAFDEAHTGPTVVDNDTVAKAAAAAAASADDDDEDEHEAETIVQTTAQIDDGGGFFDARTREIPASAVRDLVDGAHSAHEVETRVHALDSLQAPSLFDESEPDTQEVDVGALIAEDEGPEPGLSEEDFGGDGLEDPFGDVSLEEELFSDLEPGSEDVDVDAVDPFAPLDDGDADADPYDFGVKPGEPRPKVAAVLNTFAAVMAGLVLVAGLIYFFGANEVRRRAGGPVRGALELPALDGVQLTSTRWLKYPTSAGTKVLVVTGEALNGSDADQDDVYVVAELRDLRGRVMGQARAPVGLDLGPTELTALAGQQSVERAYAVRAGQQTSPRMPARKTVGYTAVFIKPPRGTESMVHALKLERGEPIVPIEPVPPQPQDQPTVDPESGDSETDGQALDDGERKGKRKGRKGKRRKKRRKGKRKAAVE